MQHALWVVSILQAQDNWASLLCDMDDAVPLANRSVRVCISKSDQLSANHGLQVHLDTVDIIHREKGGAPSCDPDSQDDLSLQFLSVCPDIKGPDGVCLEEGIQGTLHAVGCVKEAPIQA